MRDDYVVEPTAAGRAAYDEVFDVYQDLPERLAPVHKRLNR